MNHRRIKTEFKATKTAATKFAIVAFMAASVSLMFNTDRSLLGLYFDRWATMDILSHLNHYSFLFMAVFFGFLLWLSLMLIRFFISTTFKHGGKHDVFRYNDIVNIYHNPPPVIPFADNVDHYMDVADYAYSQGVKRPSDNTLRKYNIDKHINF